MTKSKTCQIYSLLSFISKLQYNLFTNQYHVILLNNDTKVEYSVTVKLLNAHLCPKPEPKWTQLHL